MAKSFALTLFLTLVSIHAVYAAPYVVRIEDDAESPVFTPGQFMTNEPKETEDVISMSVAPSAAPPLIVDPMFTSEPQITASMEPLPTTDEPEETSPEEPMISMTAESETTPFPKMGMTTPAPVNEIDNMEQTMVPITEMPAPIPTADVEMMEQMPDPMVSTPSFPTTTIDDMDKTPIPMNHVSTPSAEIPDKDEMPIVYSSPEPVVDDLMYEPCGRAFKECRFTFMGAPDVPEFSLKGVPDVAFTSKVISKDRKMKLGVLNSNDIVPEFISKDGTVTPIAFAGATPPFTPTHFKPYSIPGTFGSGVGHQTFQGNQEHIAKGKCVRVFFTSFQILSKEYPSTVVKNKNDVPKSENACVVFKISA